MKFLSQTMDKISFKTPKIHDQPTKDLLKLQFLASQNPALYAIMRVMKSDQNGLNKTLAQIQIFLMVFWMLNFVMAYEDNSSIMTDNGLNIAFNFRTWNIVDGSISLFLLFIFLLASAAVQKYNIKNFSDFFSNHKIKSIIFCLVALTKLIWLFIGLYFFSQLKFPQTSPLLMQFILTYFVGFIGGCLYFAQSALRKKHITDAFAEFGREMNIRDIGQAVEKVVEILDERERDESLSGDKRRARLFGFLEDQAMIIPFLMVMNFILTVKDESSCMDMEIEGINFTFRTWHKIQGIILIIFIVSSSMVSYATVRLFLQLPLPCRPIFYLSFCLHFTDGALLLSWLVVGVVAFFRLPTEVCSDEVQQFSITYFVLMLMTYALLFFGQVKQCMKICV